ncbi:MAG: vanadium-dependent haloperoxidase [Chitinophagaceae bacterium]
MNRHSIAGYFLSAVATIALFTSCSKHDVGHNGNHQPVSYSSEVIDKWMTLQLRLMRNATGIANHAFSRHFAYAGVAALESMAPGLPAHTKWSGRWNGLTGLPVFNRSVHYYYPANANAALAAINKAMFPNANSADKIAIDSLEAALNQSFLNTQPQALITASSDFGRQVAAAVFNWSETDGYKVANSPYNPPVGPGLWKPTAPAFASPATPYWGNNRTIISGSIENTQPSAPPAYSVEPGTSFHNMVKYVYDASQNLTDDQKAMAIFWRDVPGVSSPGHWLSILQQVIRHKSCSLDKAALAYALTGTAVNDALISCFKTKYQFNLVRPITYIREVMGQAAWSPYLGTPAHPEYPSAHSSLSAAAALVIENLFGNSGMFIDHTYDYLGFTPRSYSTFSAIATEAGQSRFFAGIHYQVSINAGLEQGRKVTANIFWPFFKGGKPEEAITR